MEIVGLIITGIEKVGSATKAVVSDPRDKGRAVAGLHKWGREFRLGISDELKFSRLLRRMYPKSGEGNEIGVPRIDFLSDIERDLLLEDGVQPSEISKWFEEWYILSGRLLQTSRILLPRESELPEALADLEKRTNGASGVAELASADLISSQESVQECIDRFNLIASTNEAHGWATRRCEKFPGILTENRDLHKVNIGNNFIDSIDLVDATHLLNTQSKSLAVSLNSAWDCAKLFYESDDGTSQVLQVDHNGIFTSNRPDIEDKVCEVEWFRLMAILLHESLKLSKTFLLKEIALVLLQAVSKRLDMARIHQGSALDRCLSVGRRHQISTHVALLRLLFQLSVGIRVASWMFVQAPRKRPVLGLTFAEAKKEPQMPGYTYMHLEKAERKLKDMLNSLQNSVEHGGLRNPFNAPGALQSMSAALVRVMRNEVERVQLAYHKKAKKREKINISGSMWLDRIAKGKLLTSERSKELTYKRSRKDVPQEMESQRETSFYLPMYSRTVIFPNAADLMNVEYARLQIGTSTDLTSVVSVLVALILWADGQDCAAVEKAIAADERGTAELVQFSSGGLGAELRKMLIAKGEAGLKIGGLVSCVDENLFGPMDKDWVVREALSVARFLGATYTTASARTAAYLKGVEVVRSGNFNSEPVIEADVPVPLNGVSVRRVITARGDVEFLLQDDSIQETYEITLLPFRGVTVDELTAAMEPARKGGRRELIVHLTAGPTRNRDIRGSQYGRLDKVAVQ